MNKKIIVLVIITIVLLVGVLGYNYGKKPASTEQSQSNNSQNTQPISSPTQQNNLQTSKDIIQCGSVSQKILTQYDYQPTASEKEATIKSLACINQALIKCSSALLTINNTNGTISITLDGQGKLGCNVGVKKYTGEIVTCPLPSDYIAGLQKKFALNNHDATIVTDLITNIDAEISSGNKSGNCTVAK